MIIQTSQPTDFDGQNKESIQFLQGQIVCFTLQARMLLCLLFFLHARSSAQRSEPMFSAVTKTALRPDYENNPSQLNYGMAVTDVDGDGDLEIFVAG